MKRTLTVILLVLAFVSVVLAFDLVITIPTNDGPRIQEAFGNVLNLGRPATAAEVQAATKQWIIQTTKDYEKRKDMAQFSPPPLEMQPTATPTPTPGLRAAAPAVAPAAVKTPAPTPTPKPKKK